MFPEEIPGGKKEKNVFLIWRKDNKLFFPMDTTLNLPNPRINKYYGLEWDLSRKHFSFSLND